MFLECTAPLKPAWRGDSSGITPKDKDILLAPVDSKVTLQVTLLCKSLLACPNL